MERIFLANALVTDQHDRMLAVRKNKSKYFQMVGGKLENNEHPLTALKREFLEEINIDITLHEVTFLGQHETLAVNEANTIVHAHVYHVRLNHLHDLKIASEIEEMAWITKENYNDYQLAHLLEEFSLPIWLNI